MPQMQPKVRELLTKLRMDAFLEIRAGYVDSGAAPGKNTAWVDPAQLRPETTTKEEVASRKHMKRLLWTLPIPGTNRNANYPGTQTGDNSTGAVVAGSAAAASASRPASDSTVGAPAVKQ
jgi:hypothetical protein